MSTIAKVATDNPLDAEAIQGNMQVLLTALGGASGVAALTEFIAYLAANGLAGTNSGDLVVDNVILKTGTAAALAAVVLPAGSLAVTSDTHELLIGDGATAGGIAAGRQPVAVTPVALTTYQIQAAKHQTLFISDWNVAVSTTGTYPAMMRFPLMKAGDTLDIFIAASTGINLANQILLNTGDLGGTESPTDYTGLILNNGTAINLSPGDQFQIIADTTLAYISFECLGVKTGQTYLLVRNWSNIQVNYP